MIELNRALARQFRAVLRRSLMEQGPRDAGPLVLCRTDAGGLTLQATLGDLALRYHRPGKHADAAIVFRATVLAAFEGRTDAPVTLEPVEAGKGRARWLDGAVPRESNFTTVAPKDVQTFPDVPSKWTKMPANLPEALEEAARTAPRNAVRLALSRVLLRGKKGEVIATDGKQLLIQGGFAFPWTEDVLVPRVPAFGCREFAEGNEVTVGRTKTHVAVAAGPWTLLLGIDAAGRYPDVNCVIPRSASGGSLLKLDAEDAAFLAAALPKLPGDEADAAPVTLDLGAPPAVRARADGAGQPIEVALARSTVSGPPVLVCVNRGSLYRALRLGFTDFQVIRADAPVVCRDPSRTYLWMPIDKNAAIPRGGMPLAAASGEKRPSQTPPHEPENPTMPPPPTNGHDSTSGRNGAPQPERWGIEEVIAEAEALRGVLQDASLRTARLLAALKHQRRQSRAVKAAMDSLRQLQLDR